MECGACAVNCPVSAIDVKKGVGCAYAVMMMKFKAKKMAAGARAETEIQTAADLT